MSTGLLVACGHASDEPRNEEELTVLEQLEIEMDPPVSPGTEFYQCRRYDIGRARGASLHALRWVVPSTAVRLHHAMMFATAEPGSNGAVACDPMPPPVAVLPLYAPGAEELHFTEGVSIAIPDSATALFVELHVLRLGEGSGTASVELDSTPAPPAHLAGWVDDLAPVPTLEPHTRATATGSCRFEGPARLVAAWPHMHALGTAFRGTVVRADGRRERFLDVAWDFNHQELHPVDVALDRDDAIETECNWTNTSDSPVAEGPFSKDEMCNQGLVVWPRELAHCGR